MTVMSNRVKEELKQELKLAFAACLPLENRKGYAVTAEVNPWKHFPCLEAYKGSPEVYATATRIIFETLDEMKINVSDTDHQDVLLLTQFIGSADIQTFQGALAGEFTVCLPGDAVFRKVTSSYGDLSPLNSPFSFFLVTLGGLLGSYVVPRALFTYPVGRRISFDQQLEKTQESFGYYACFMRGLVKATKFFPSTATMSDISHYLIMIFAHENDHLPNVAKGGIIEVQKYALPLNADNRLPLASFNFEITNGMDVAKKLDFYLPQL